LSDTATYDITAWSIPYAHGVEAFGIKELVTVEVAQTVNAPALPGNNDYAYLIPYRSLSELQLLADLLKEGIRVRNAERDFTYGGTRFPKGTLIVLKSNNNGKINRLLALAAQHKSTVTGVSTGFMEAGFDFGSDKIHEITTPNVALVVSDDASPTAVGEVWHFFEQELNFPLAIFNERQLSSNALKQTDVLIFADGYYKLLGEKDGVIKNWVKQGGRLIVLENAAATLAGAEWGLKLKTDEEADAKKEFTGELKKYEQRDRVSISSNTPGAIYRTEIDGSHPVGFGYDNDYFSLKMSKLLFEFMKEGWNVAALRKDSQVSGFAGSTAAGKIKDGTIVACFGMGNGKVVAFADNPLFRSFWEGGKLLFSNAVFLTAP
jgi:hypothetical protein